MLAAEFPKTNKVHCGKKVANKRLTADKLECYSTYRLVGSISPPLFGAGEMMPKLYSGSELLLESLSRQQVEVFFGLPGGAVLPLYDALYSAGIRHLLVRHEQAAAFAADGYARVTGKPGVCLGTSGPGATNLITGLTSAMMDSIPVVALTGQVPAVADRQGWLPGGRYDRHQPSQHQAIVPGAVRGRDPVRD